jgi:putative ABC transport system substrate-binding protein
MRRRTFLALLSGAAALPLQRSRRAWAQGKVWRIGILETVSLATNPNFDSFRAGMKERGYVEGKNLVIAYRTSDGRDELYPALASELMALKVDLIVARGTPAIVAAKDVRPTVPVVMAAIADPFRVVKSIARPGGNVTGLTSLLADIYPKRVELLAEMLPGLKRIAFLSNLATFYAPRTRDEISKAAAVLGLQAEFIDTVNAEDLAPAFAESQRRGIQALIMATGGVTQAHQDAIARLAIEHRIPVMYGAREFVEAGGLISLAPSYLDLYRRAAGYVDRIFKGASPGDLPIEQPVKFEIVVNLRTAKAIGLSIAESFLARADEVIE